MDQLLQRGTCSDKISMLDGFSGYNQILVSQENKETTTFTMQWGTFMYVKINFGLINAGATFQRAMNLAFVGNVNKFIVIYLDDLIVFSESDAKHIKHLKKAFHKCRKFEISHNPKIIVFTMMEGKLLGHIISKEGVIISPKGVSTI